MQIQLCKKSIERLGAGMPSLLSCLRDRDHSPTVKDCLNRCQTCDQGFIIATADGLPMRAKQAEQLLHDLDSMAEEDE